MTVDPSQPTFDEVLAPASPDVRLVADALRSLLLREMPDAVEWVDLGNRIAAYGPARRMREVAFAIAPHTAHVNLQFAEGALLSDPAGLMAGTGRKIRHVKCRSVADVERPALHELVREQLRFRGLGGQPRDPEIGGP